MRSLYAFDTGHCTEMKISTVPFFPASDFSEWSLLSTSGKVKSSIVAPIAGGAGTSPAARAPTAMAPAITHSDANSIDKFLVLINNSPLTRSEEHTSELQSHSFISY